MKINSFVFIVIFLLTFSTFIYNLDGGIQSERPEPAVKDFWVDAFRGSDFNDGTEAKPWKTITYAISVINTMAFPMTLHIRQGKYDLSSGETFPIRMRDYISLVGYDPQSTVIDAVNSNQSVIFCNVNNISIEKLTITGGSGVLIGDYDYRGGGLLIDSSDIVIRNSIIRSNYSAFRGAGIYCIRSKARIIDSLITENHAGRFGGGIFCDSDSLQITNSIIISNSSSLAGGGIYCDNSSPRIFDCQIMDNHVAPIDAGLYYEVYGGGIACYNNSAPLIESCKINFNISNSFGGGIYCNWSSPAIINSEINGNIAMTGSGGGIGCDNSLPQMNNCLVIRNNAQSNEGGGIFCKDSSRPSFFNNTMVDNISPNGGGAVAVDERSSANLLDSIIWRCGDRPIKGNVIANHCDIEGIQPDLRYGNFSEDPLFYPGPWGEFYLSSIQGGQYINSPCIDKGSQESSISGLDMATTRTDGIFDKGTVDIGFHYPPHIQFTLHTMPDKFYFYDSETIRILLDLKKVAPSHFVDIYFIMINNSTGELFSAPYWNKGFSPAATNIPLPIEIFFRNAVMFESLKGDQSPPIYPQGTYTFAMVAFLAGTHDFISNIATTSFFVSYSPMGWE